MKFPIKSFNKKKEFAIVPGYITLLSFDLWRNYYNKNVVLFEENSILLLPQRLESSGW